MNENSHNCWEGSLPCSQNPSTGFIHEQLRSNFKSPKSVSTRSTLTSVSNTLATLSPELHKEENSSRPGHAIPILTQVFQNVSYIEHRHSMPTLTEVLWNVSYIKPDHSMPTLTEVLWNVSYIKPDHSMPILTKVFWNVNYIKPGHSMPIPNEILWNVSYIKPTTLCLY